jgi:hypothetical protein
VPPKTTESPQDHKINERGSFASKFAWVIPLVGSAFAFGFLLLDRRCHEVLLGNYKLGKELEQWKTGYYSTARERGKRPKQITHTAVLESIYFTSGVVFLSLAAFWIFADNPVEAATNAKIPDDVKENIASGVLLLVKSLPGLILSFLGYKLLSPNVSALTELKEPCIKEVMKKIQCAQIAGGIISGIGIVFIFLVTCGYLKG